LTFIKLLPPQFPSYIAIHLYICILLCIVELFGNC